MNTSQTTNEAVEQKLQSFLLNKFPLARTAGINRDTLLLERGILDSLGILDVVAFVEGEFSIVLFDEELVPENFRSIDALTSFLRRKLSNSK
jgi:acyl carrier protein